MVQMYCTFCGAIRPDSASFCSSSGKPATPAAASAVSATVPGSAQRPDMVYFCVGSTKLVLMTISTFTLYSLYWFYRNWKVELAISRDLFSPLLRTIFIVLFFYAFAARVKERGLGASVRVTYSPAFLTAAFCSSFYVQDFPTHSG